MSKWYLLIATGVICCLVVGSAHAAEDCQKLLQDIKKERNFFKHRSLVQEAIEQCPDNPQVNFKHAFTLQRSKKQKEALRFYGRAVKLDPNFANAYFGMGDVYLEMKKPKQAMKAYEMGLKIDPVDTRAIKSLMKAKSQANKRSS